MAYTFTPVTGIQNAARAINPAANQNNAIIATGVSPSGYDPDYADSEFMRLGAGLDFADQTVAKITADYNGLNGHMYVSISGSGSGGNYSITVATADGTVLVGPTTSASVPQNFALDSKFLAQKLIVRAVNGATNLRSECKFNPSTITPHTN